MDLSLCLPPCKRVRAKWGNWQVNASGHVDSLLRSGKCFHAFFSQRKKRKMIGWFYWHLIFSFQSRKKKLMATENLSAKSLLQRKAKNLCPSKPFKLMSLSLFCIHFTTSFAVGNLWTIRGVGHGSCTQSRRIARFFHVIYGVCCKLLLPTHPGMKFMYCHGLIGFCWWQALSHPYFLRVQLKHPPCYNCHAPVTLKVIGGIDS